MQKKMSDLEQLAVAQAVYNAVGKIVATKGDSLRARCDRAMLHEFHEEGTDRRRVMVNGQCVGTYTVRMKKTVDGVEPELVEPEKFIKWIRESDGGLDMLKRLVYGEPAKTVRLAAADGELPDGCRIRRVIEPERENGTMLKVEPSAVAAALSDGLPAAIAGLIGGGDES